EAVRIRKEVSAQKQSTRQLREGAKAAAAKLLYLLGLDPSAELVPADRQLVAFRLVDVGVPIEQLVERALAGGPGVRELEGLLSLIQQAQAKSQGLGALLPTLDVRMAEGVFGAGPGSRSDWDNRWDLGVQARWNLTPLLTATDRKRVAQAKMQQAHLSYQDLRAKLTMGVQEAYEATRSGRDQMTFAEQQMKEANEAYERSLYRYERKIKGYSLSEVLLAVRSLGGAQLAYLQAVRDQDKAQIRLLVLLGLGAETCPH